MDPTRTFTRVVAGTTVSVELSVANLHPSHDLQADAGGVASLIGLVGELLANATRQADLADAAYRNWKGQEATAQLAADPKQAEWKVQAAIEASPLFLRHKDAIATANADIEFLRAFHDALRVKASMVRARVELHVSTGAAGRGGPDMRDDRLTEAEERAVETMGANDMHGVSTREDRVRAIMRRRETPAAG